MKKFKHFNFRLTRVRHILYNRLEHRDANYTWTNFLRRLPQREKQSFLNHSSNRESLLQELLKILSLRKKSVRYCQAKEKFHFTKPILVTELFDLLSCKKSQTVGFLSLNLMKLFLCKEQLTTELAVLYKRQEFSSILGLRKFTWAFRYWNWWLLDRSVHCPPDNKNNSEDCCLAWKVLRNWDKSNDLLKEQSATRPSCCLYQVKRGKRNGWEYYEL